MKLAIIGLGLIGGSLAKAIRKRFPDYQIYGVDKKAKHAEFALQTGMIDKICTFQYASQNADIIALATNMDAIENLLPRILDTIQKTQIVFDLGSTKSSLEEIVSSHPMRSRYVALHPIAGTEFSGPENALSDLYRDKMMIICHPERSDKDAFTEVKTLMSNLQMQLVSMNATEHDEHIAYVSHLSHIISFALGNTVLEKEKNTQNILTMAGSGFTSTVRLAKSSPKMWTPIFKNNKKNVLQSIQDFKSELERLEKFVASDDWINLEQYLKESNKIKKILK